MKPFLMNGLVLILFLCVPGWGTASESKWDDIFISSEEEFLVERIPIQDEIVSIGFFSEEDKMAAYGRPPSIKTNLIRRAGTGKISSQRVLEGESLVIPSGNFLVTQPPEVIQPEWWTAQVVNGRGQKIKEFKGQGAFPKMLAWDGLQEGWNRIQAGELYNFIFLVKPARSQIKKIVGQPFSFEAFQQTTKNKIALTFDSSVLFEKSSPEQLTKRGTEWLLASCRTILKYPGQPISIDVFSQEVQVGQGQQARLVKSVSDILMMDPELILSDIHVDPLETAQVKIQILGVSDEN